MSVPTVDPVLAMQPDVALANRIAASADAWKRKLLDLTKRNRALNFKPTKVSTVAIVDEQPAEVFRRLYVRERTMRFKAAAEPVPATDTSSEEEHSAATVNAAGAGLEDTEEMTAVASDFAPYDPATLGERHTDEYLQTTSQPDALDKSLRRLDEQARQSIEEQGVNTLFIALGMLNYRDSKDSEITFRAPLVLLPVELTRKSARSGYTVKASDDEPIVNPALVEYLKRDFAITLPDLPESSVMPDDYDLQSLFTEIVAIIEGKSWSVKADVYLGLFSFQKFAMYKDLEANEEPLKAHRLIRQLVSRESDDSATHVVGLPDDVRQMPLDREFPPEGTAQVVDADSSQLRAIAATAQGYDLVIEGPPGTGKSQTITNLIAQALASGKSVLFVAEKMAALQVVYDRLRRAKLGEFCLELHSTKANKRAVMAELASTLDASLQSVAAPTVSTQRLPRVRATLTEYVEAVHAPHGTLAASPYHGYGELARVLGAPRVKYSGPLDQGVSREQLDQTVRDLADLAATSIDVGVPAEHPWRDTTKSFYSEDALTTVGETALALVRANAELTRLAQAFFASYDPPREEALSLIERGREVQELATRVGQSFSDEVLEQDHAADIAYVEQKSQGLLSVLAFLDGRYRAIKARWLRYRQPGYAYSLAEQADDMKVVDRLRGARQALVALEPRARELVGGMWRGESSDFAAIEEYVNWVVELRAACVWRGVIPKGVESPARAKGPDLRDVAALRDAATRQQSTLERLRSLVGWPADHLDAAPLTELSARAQLLADNLRLAAKWAAFESARVVASRGIAHELLPASMSGELAFRDLVPAFLRAFWMGWLSVAVQKRHALSQFHTLTHEQRLKEFRELDERVLMENRAAVVGALRDRVQHALRSSQATSELPYLRREMAKQRALAPLRRTMRQAGTAIRAIKPCFMMSPLTVAQLLEGGSPSFDLVIFDEASQLPPEDAVGAIMRGAKLVVVGDPKQLPPTDFFAVTSGVVNQAVDDEGEPLVQDAESILEEFMGAGVPMSRLKWHYRSAHESLINFSNVSFYESDLYTFPSVETGNTEDGLQFEYLPDGVYEGKGLNAVEAKRVADEVVAFAKEQRAEGPGPRAQRKSLGVGTFNLRQQLAILDELEQRRRDDPSIEPFFDRSAPEPFFVKNLENIQGDERDVIFISVTYGRAADGRIRFNFGPLNGENGWRRLNVLTTRARQRMKVFSSMRGEDINAAASTSRGAQLLREFLLYAERGRLESVSASLAASTESPFEKDVAGELTARGVKVVPQVGVAGYRIDLAVVDDAAPGRFVCGIECDGVAYHASETARDRDRLRQQVLEARGWTIHRVWSTDWFKDRAGQIDRLMSLVAASREEAVVASRAGKPVQEHPAPATAPARSQERPSPSQAVESAPASAYERPVGVPYVVTPGEGRYTGREILDAPTTAVAEAVTLVVNTEAPVHEHELLARVAGMWGTRAGSRIVARIGEVIKTLVARKDVERRGDFFWSKEGTCTVRSRSGTRIPGERIAPEEYRAAVEMVLASGHAFSRAQLVSEARAVLGYARTGAALEEGISEAVESLLADGAAGEGSAGVKLRG